MNDVLLPKLSHGDVKLSLEVRGVDTTGMNKQQLITVLCDVIEIEATQVRHSTLIQPSFNPHSTLIQPSFNSPQRRTYGSASDELPPRSARHRWVDGDARVEPRHGRGGRRDHRAPCARSP